MGSKTWMLVYSDEDARQVLQTGPVLDRDATEALVKKLFPTEKWEPLDDVSLVYTNPPDGQLIIGSFPGLSVVATTEVALDYPSRLAKRFLDPALGRRVCLHAMHSVVDWFAYATWVDGTLQRSLSLSPDSGVMEDIGTPLPFEAPYWAGQHPASDPEDEDEDDRYPFVFHPLDLGQAALVALFGYQLEGTVDPSHLDADRVPLMRLKRRRPWWKL